VYIDGVVTTGGKSMNGWTRAAVLVALTGVACGNKSTGGDNQVFFVGYVYDGASGTQLTKAMISDASITYGDAQIKVDIQDDGRIISRDPMPTWRDYTVTIDANGYRSFVSYNTGIDVPASLAMTAGVAQASTVQTLDFAAFLFPVALKSPPIMLTVTAPGTGGMPTTSMVSGTLRLRPQGLSSLQIGSGTLVNTPVSRVWANDQDLLTQTVEKSFTDGSVSIAEGELVYGVSYEVAVFGVAGEQPLVMSGQNGIVAGSVTSRTFALVEEARDPLAIVQNDATSCTPPLPTDTTYGGKVTLTFNTPIEIVGTTYREDFDNALMVTEPTPPVATMPPYTTTYYCPLKMSLNDPSQQERGSKIEVAGASLIFSFNPSVGLTTTYPGTTACTLPPSFTSISYAGANTLVVQPVGDPLRHQTLANLLFQTTFTSSTVTCPMRPQ
jgi:hypothetical protein